MQTAPDFQARFESEHRLVLSLFDQLATQRAEIARHRTALLEALPILTATRGRLHGTTEAVYGPVDNAIESVKLALATNPHHATDPRLAMARAWLLNHLAQAEAGVAEANRVRNMIQHREAHAHCDRVRELALPLLALLDGRT